jgi:hypothetical protein
MIPLTQPLRATDIRAAHPRSLLAVTDEEIDTWLPILESALRSQYTITQMDSSTDEVLGMAMIAAWPSFQQQIRNVANEGASPEGYNATYGAKFTFPAVVGVILAPVSDLAMLQRIGSRSVVHRFDW